MNETKERKSSGQRQGIEKAMWTRIDGLLVRLINITQDAIVILNGKEHQLPRLEMPTMCLMFKVKPNKLVVVK